MAHVGRLRSGERVCEITETPLEENLRVRLTVILRQIDSRGRPFFLATGDFGRIVGSDTCVKTTWRDDIFCAQYRNRQGFRRQGKFVRGRTPNPTSLITVVLARLPDGQYRLFEAWYGPRAEPFPWDPRRNDRSDTFWMCHALCAEHFDILPGSETVKTIARDPHDLPKINGKGKKRRYHRGKAQRSKRRC